MIELAESILTFFAVLCGVSIMTVISVACWVAMYEIWRAR